MSEILEKPKSRTEQLIDLGVNQKLHFPISEKNSIKALISGNNKPGIKSSFPHRKYTTKIIMRWVNADGVEDRVFEVTREK